MAHLALDRALPAQWIDEVFQANRQRQYPRELLFSSVVELMTLVTLGLRTSLHAAARQMAERLPVSLAALYAKIKRTEPAVLRALVQGSAERLAPLVACRPTQTSLPDPDSALVCDMVACEDAYESERIAASVLIEHAQAQQVWIRDRHFCTQAILQGLSQRGAGFIVREHARHPKLMASGLWSAYTNIETGRVRQQSIQLAVSPTAATQSQVWRRIEIELSTPTEAGDKSLALWSNLPQDIDAATIACLYRKRWRIEGLFQRMESVLNSEISSLGYPKAALEVSTFHLAVEISSGYEAMRLILPLQHLPCADDDPRQLVHRLLFLASRLQPAQLVTSKQAAKPVRPKGYVASSIARSQVSTARALKEAGGKRR